MKGIILLICFLVVSITSCYGIGYYEANWGETAAESLLPKYVHMGLSYMYNSQLNTGPFLRATNKKAGDLISCGAKHVMLATGSDTVIHVVGNKDSHKAHIVEQHVDEIENYANCRNEGAGARGREGSVQLARQHMKYFGGKEFFYDLLTCNCEHWARYWNNGNWYSWLSTHYAHSNCKMKDLPQSFFRSVDCWWTGCQLHSWAVRGCSQYNRWERNTQHCTDGIKFQCCSK